MQSCRITPCPIYEAFVNGTRLSPRFGLQIGADSIGLKEVDDGIWLVTFMHHDLAYIDLEQKIWQPIDNLLGTRVSPMCPERISF